MAARKKPEADTAEAPAETTTSELIKFEGLSAERAPAIFGHGTLGEFAEKARAAVINEVPDLSTLKGRKRVASLAAEVARSKTAVSDCGVTYLRLLKEQPKVIEAELKLFREAMDALRDEVRAPLNAWQAEQDAIADKLQAAIDQVVERFTLAPDATADEIQSALFHVEQEPLTEDVFGDRLEEAETKRAYGITLLTEQLSKRQQYEAEQAELVENRRKIAQMEEEKRIKDAADLAVENERKRVEQDNQRKATEQQNQRDEDARKLREAEQKVRQAELDRIAAEQNAENERRLSEQRQKQAVENERLRLEREQAERERVLLEQIEQQRRDDEARAANRAHCGAINKTALDAILAINLNADDHPARHLNADEAKAIITAIIRGQIPAVTISY